MNNSETIEIGTVTFMVNIGKDETISDDEMVELSAAITAEFKKAAERRKLENEISVLSTTVGRGCVTVALTIGAVVVATGAAAKVVLSFLKDYEDIRNGALLLSKDINGIKVKIERWTEKRFAWLFRDDLISCEEARSRLDKKAKNREKRK